MPIQSTQPESLRQRRKNQHFHLDCLWATPYYTLATFSVYHGIFLSLYASAHHPHLTWATGEWMISFPNKDSSDEVGSTEFILFLSHQYMQGCYHNLTMNNPAWAAKTLILWVSAAGGSQAYFSSSKGFYQCGCYCKERLCSQNYLKVCDSVEKWHFHWDHLWDPILHK